MNTRMTLLAALTTAVCLQSARAADAPAPLAIPDTPEAPILDGVLDDACWRAAPSLERWYAQDGGEPVAHTTLRLARDGRWLYAGAECRNPRMGHVRQRVFERDGPVFTDDALSLFVRPDPATRAVYEFSVNFANVQFDKRVTADGARDEAWSAPWRSATRSDEGGWTAELAIPLVVFETDDLAGLRLQPVRSFLEVRLDEMQAFDSDRRINFGPRPGWKTAGDAAFLETAGLGGFTPEPPFVPRIAAARALGYGRDAAGLHYGVDVDLDTGTPVPGEALLQVLEQRDAGPAVALAQPVSLAAHEARTVRLAVPATDLGERALAVRLVEPGRPANALAVCELDRRALQVFTRVLAGRSYVTTEPLPVRVELGLSEPLLRDMTLTLEVNGKAAVEQRGPAPAGTLDLPLESLREGDNPVTVRLSAGGAELAARALTARRLPPRPGFEVKLDLLKGVMLKDGAPYFPVAIYTHFLYPKPAAPGEADPTEPVFKFLAEDIGLNTVVRLRAAEHLDRYVELARAYGLNVINWAYPDVADLPQRMKSDPSFAAGSAALPLEARRAIWRGWYEAGAPKAAEETRFLRDCPNMIGYYNQDEPNLPPQQFRLAWSEWYADTVMGIDPYRPLMLLYARQVPAGDEWTRWGGILGYDVYPNSHAGGSMYDEPGWGTSYYAWELRERCRRDHKVMWFVPLANLIQPARQPVGMSPAHMLCQAYSAIIYGARGLLYFALPNVVGPDAWGALRTIAAQVRELSPALLNGDPPQDIRYPNESLNPRGRQFPMVNAILFQYPDGRFLLLAANIRDVAAQTEFRLAGLGRAERVCGGDGPLEQSQGGFTDLVEGYGTRAYRLALEPPAGPVRVDVCSTAREDRRAPRVDVHGIMARVMLGKNHMPNPCFERQFNRGVPDFFKPTTMSLDDGRPGSAWFVDESVRWEGKPSLKLAKSMFGVCYPPRSPRPAPMTLSFHARGAVPGASVSWTLVGAGSANRSFTVTTNWARYHLAFERPAQTGREAGLLFVMGAKREAVWLNGLQLEAGTEPTDFVDDALPRAAAPPADPGNRLANGGAETGTAAGWTGLERMVPLGESGVRRDGARGSRYAFYWRGQSGSIQSDPVAVDPARGCVLSGLFKAEAPASNAAGRVALIFGVVPEAESLRQALAAGRLDNGAKRGKWIALVRQDIPPGEWTSLALPIRPAQWWPGVDRVTVLISPKLADGATGLWMDDLALREEDAEQPAAR